MNRELNEAKKKTFGPELMKFDAVTDRLSTRTNSDWAHM